MDQFTPITEDKGLYKKILREGIGSFPRDGAIVSIYYTGVLENGTIFEENKSGDGLIFRIGSQNESEDGSFQVIPGLEKAIRTMRKGEKAIIVMRSDYGYGDEGFLSIPPFSSLIYSIDLINIK
jgi:FKBP-type peptidyl-prolyl cis-trans isomerase